MTSDQILLFCAKLVHSSLPQRSFDRLRDDGRLPAIEGAFCIGGVVFSAVAAARAAGVTRSQVVELVGACFDVIEHERTEFDSIVSVIESRAFTEGDVSAVETLGSAMKEIAQDHQPVRRLQ